MTKLEDAADHLLHYFTLAGVTPTGDARAEMEYTVELIIQATMERMRIREAALGIGKVQP